MDKKIYMKDGTDDLGVVGGSVNEYDYISKILNWLSRKIICKSQEMNDADAWPQEPFVNCTSVI